MLGVVAFKARLLQLLRRCEFLSETTDCFLCHRVLDQNRCLVGGLPLYCFALFLQHFCLVVVSPFTVLATWLVLV